MHVSTLPADRFLACRSERTATEAVDAWLADRFCGPQQWEWVGGGEEHFQVRGTPRMYRLSRSGCWWLIYEMGGWGRAG